MSDLIRCSGCLGKKKVLKMGLFEGNCDQCEGIGWIKSPEVIAAPVEPKVEIASKASTAKKSKS